MEDKRLRNKTESEVVNTGKNQQLKFKENYNGIIGLYEKKKKRNIIQLELFETPA